MHKMTRRLYMDNAATSFPKPPCVHQAMADYATRLGASAGRGAYAEAIETGQIIEQCRTRIAKLINAPASQQIIMTSNCSDALNLAIRGLLGPGDHAITTWMDHNSVLRPLDELSSRMGLQVSFVQCDQQGLVDPQDIARQIKSNTKLIAVLHGSNVTGTVEPISEIARVAKDHGIPILVDAAQTCGHWPIDVQAQNINLLAVAGHKGPLGPLGTGFLYIQPGIEEKLLTLKQGGTGTGSELPTQPQSLPDKYEPGSHNALGIAGLNAGVGYLLERTIDDLHEHDRTLCRRFIDGIEQIENLRWFGPKDLKRRIGVFSIRIPSYSPEQLAAQLERQFGILTRSGLHCAPLAHKTIGTFDSLGTTRISFGPFVTGEDIDYTLQALAQIASSIKTTATA